MKNKVIPLLLILLIIVLCSCKKGSSNDNTAAIKTLKYGTSSNSISVSSAAVESNTVKSNTVKSNSVASNTSANKPVLASKPVTSKPATTIISKRPATSSTDAVSRSAVPPVTTPLTAAKISEIKQAWLLIEQQNHNKFVKTVGDLLIPKYYGTFNDAIVIGQVRCKNDSVLCVVTYYKIAGYNFARYDSLDYLYVFKNHKFYDLSEAYKQGIISKKNIADISYYNQTMKFLHGFDSWGK